MPETPSAGSSASGSGRAQRDDDAGLEIVLVRHLADARLDHGFGAVGVVRTPVTGDDEARALLVDRDGGT